jgi:hypothetical protein
MKFAIILGASYTFSKYKEDTDEQLEIEREEPEQV